MLVIFRYQMIMLDRLKDNNTLFFGVIVLIVIIMWFLILPAPLPSEVNKAKEQPSVNTEDNGYEDDYYQ